MSKEAQQDLRARSRATRLSTKLQGHIAKHKDKWVAAEEQRLRKARPLKAQLSRRDGPKPPPGAAPKKEARDLHLRAAARSNVTARTEKRMNALRERSLSRNFNQTRSPQAVQARAQSRGRSR